MLRALLVVLVSLFGSNAEGASVSQEDLAGMVRILAPLVEERTGGEFDGYPSLVLTEADTARDELQRQRFELLLASGELSTGHARRLAKRSTRQELVGALALYADGQIYLLADRIEELFSSRGFDPHLLSPLMQCVLTHELTHALQDQVAPMQPPADLESAWVALAISEGFASLVQFEVCSTPHRLEAQRVLDQEQGLLDRVPDEGDLVYGLGRDYMAVRYEQEGTEGLWSALRDPPPDAASLLATVYPQDPQAEAFLDLFASCSASMGVEGAMGQLDTAVIADLTPRRGGPSHGIAVNGIVDAVRYFERGTRGEEVVISVAWFRGEGQAQRFVETLHRELRDARKELRRKVAAKGAGVLVVEFNHTLVHFRSARRRVEADATFGMEERPGPGQRMRAYWVSRDDLLVVVFLYGVRAGKGRVADAIQPLFDFVPLDGERFSGTAGEEPDVGPAQER
jgi:hypothetical protein